MVKIFNYIKNKILNYLYPRYKVDYYILDLTEYKEKMFHWLIPSFIYAYYINLKYGYKVRVVYLKNLY
jgi:hypothetical protein